MIKQPFKLIVTMFMLVSGCQTGEAPDQLLPGYNISKPDNVLVLPGILHEISGISFIDSVTLACVQDEIGTIFFYNLSSKEITNQISFAPKGDFEGIARSDSSIFILRSDGTLFEVANFRSGDATVNRYKTDVPSIDNEGLCNDPDRNMLLIACKEKVSKGSGPKEGRLIYGFDLQLRKLINEPVYVFDLRELKNFALKSKADIPVKSKKKSNKLVPDFKFRPSGIAIQPGSHDLFILSSDDKLLFVFGYDGNIKNIVKLDPALFNQPEGITFLKNRDLLISNEGQNRNPTMLRFNFRE